MKTATIATATLVVAPFIVLALKWPLESLSTKTLGWGLVMAYAVFAISRLLHRRSAPFGFAVIPASATVGERYFAVACTLAIYALALAKL